MLETDLCVNRASSLWGIKSISCWFIGRSRLSLKSVRSFTRGASVENLRFKAWASLVAVSCHLFVCFLFGFRGCKWGW